jgi:hypothetical protein
MQRGRPGWQTNQLRQNFTRSLARVPGRLNKKKSQGPDTVLDIFISRSYHYNTKPFISRKIQMRCQLFPFFGVLSALAFAPALTSVHAEKALALAEGVKAAIDTQPLAANQ